MNNKNKSKPTPSNWPENDAVVPSLKQLMHKLKYNTKTSLNIHRYNQTTKTALNNTTLPRRRLYVSAREVNTFARNPRQITAPVSPGLKPRHLEYCSD